MIENLNICIQLIAGIIFIIAAFRGYGEWKRMPIVKLLSAVKFWKDITYNARTVYFIPGERTNEEYVKDLYSFVHKAAREVIMKLYDVDVLTGEKYRLQDDVEKLYELIESLKKECRDIIKGTGAYPFPTKTNKPDEFDKELNKYVNGIEKKLKPLLHFKWHSMLWVVTLLILSCFVIEGLQRLGFI